MLPFVSLIGCVSMPPGAAKVQVHSQASNLLENCQKVGPVEATAARVWGPDHAVEVAKVNLREAAFERGADTVVMLNTDIYLTRVMAQGVAFNCYGQKPGLNSGRNGHEKERPPHSKKTGKEEEMYFNYALEEKKAGRESEILSFEEWMKRWEKDKQP